MSRKILVAGACGFSLIELMIVIGISAWVSVAAYAVYNAQQISYQRQTQIVEMQQNARAFLYFIEKDLRMAGYDPKQTSTPNFISAQPTAVAFSADLGRPRGDAACGDKEICDSMSDGKIISTATTCAGCVAETIRYGLKSTAWSTGATNYGQMPIGSTTSVTKSFNHSDTTDAQDVIDSVEAIEFLYNLNDGTAVTVVGATDFVRIRSVTISLLMRTRSIVRGQQNRDVYYYPSSNAGQSSSGKKWGPFNDSYVRRLVVTNILCRNMALRAPT